METGVHLSLFQRAYPGPKELCCHLMPQQRDLLSLRAGSPVAKAKLSLGLLPSSPKGLEIEVCQPCCSQSVQPGDPGQSCWHCPLPAWGCRRHTGHTSLLRRQGEKSLLLSGPPPDYDQQSLLQRVHFRVPGQLVCFLSPKPRNNGLILLLLLYYRCLGEPRVLCTLGKCSIYH